jgi:hypothetical protein
MRWLVAIAAIAALVLAVVLAASSAEERDDRAARPQPLPHLFTVLPKRTQRQLSTGRGAHHARQVHHVRRHPHHHRRHYGRHRHHHRHHYGTFAHPNLFGTNPLQISIGASHEAANGPSGGATVSGDNRKMRLVAFHSSASNLIRGDSNGKTDVFIWHRPRGPAGLALTHLTGSLRRASISNNHRQGNGDSINPSLDGSIRTVPHCVAFQSHSTNLSPGDTNPDWDIDVRDLRTHLTYLVSAGVSAPATHPSIDGHCHKVVFQTPRWIWIGSAHGRWKPSRIALGSRPRFARDGSAVVWTHRGRVQVRRRGVVSTVGPGTNPHVSDQEYGLWGVVFDTRKRLLAVDRDSHEDVYMRILGRHRGPHRTILISKVPGGDAFNGGITVYGQNRGIVTFAIRERRGWGLWYYNKHTGNVDDLAFSRRGAVHGIATSARANFVAFTTSERISPFAAGRFRTIYFKHLVDGQSYHHAF